MRGNSSILGTNVIIYVNLNIGFQEGRIPVQVRIGKPGSEGGVGGMEPN